MCRCMCGTVRHTGAEPEPARLNGAKAGSGPQPPTPVWTIAPVAPMFAHIRVSRGQFGQILGRDFGPVVDADPRPSTALPQHWTPLPHHLPSHLPPHHLNGQNVGCQEVLRSSHAQSTHPKLRRHRPNLVETPSICCARDAPNLGRSRPAFEAGLRIVEPSPNLVEAAPTEVEAVQTLTTRRCFSSRGADTIVQAAFRGAVVRRGVPRAEGRARRLFDGRHASCQKVLRSSRVRGTRPSTNGCIRSRSPSHRGRAGWKRNPGPRVATPTTTSPHAGRSGDRPGRSGEEPRPVLGPPYLFIVSILSPLEPPLDVPSPILVDRRWSSFVALRRSSSASLRSPPVAGRHQCAGRPESRLRRWPESCTLRPESTENLRSTRWLQNPVPTAKHRGRRFPHAKQHRARGARHNTQSANVWGLTTKRLTRCGDAARRRVHLRKGLGESCRGRATGHQRARGRSRAES